jgi:gas vesicle protein
MKEKKDKQKNSSLSYFLWGLTIGSLVGAIWGILLAPKSGFEIRQSLSDKLSNAKFKTKEKATDTENIISSTVSKNSQNLEDTVKKIAQAFKAGLKSKNNENIIIENENNLNENES